MKSKDAIDALSALASEARLGVFRLLVKRGPKGYTPPELSERLGVPAPTLSFHLKGLAIVKLVTSRRQGRNLHYSPNIGRMHALVGFRIAGRLRWKRKALPRRSPGDVHEALSCSHGRGEA